MVDKHLFLVFDYVHLLVFFFFSPPNICCEKFHALDVCAKALYCDFHAVFVLCTLLLEGVVCGSSEWLLQMCKPQHACTYLKERKWVFGSEELPVPLLVLQKMQHSCQSFLCICFSIHFPVISTCRPLLFHVSIAKASFPVVWTLNSYPGFCALALFVVPPPLFLMWYFEKHLQVEGNLDSLLV